ncbi:uncharacterized protein G6M90_00g032680 [Metarhizium brunneum]|uniref:Uncharacterized protein n=1 Tax=Metarhizium brunneum TaxID=500148 RepID=A0A7D5UU23_9HYPO
MKHMTAVVALAAVAIAAPVEVEKRDGECPDTATIAYCPYPDGGIINVNIGDCEQIL